MNVIIYTKKNCQYCDLAKQLLNYNNIGFSEISIGSDIVVEEFREIFPDVKTAPFIIIENEHIGGYRELNERISEFGGRQLLSE